MTKSTRKNIIMEKNKSVPSGHHKTYFCDGVDGLGTGGVVLEGSGCADLEVEGAHMVVADEVGDVCAEGDVRVGVGEAAPEVGWA